MDNVSPQGFQQGNFKSSDVLATAPPPPSEVKIRTMRSDLQTMSQSGGGLPRFQSIKVASVPVEKTAPVASSAAVTAAVAAIASPAAVGSSGAPQTASQSKTNVFGVIATIIVLAAIVFGGWFAYTKFFNGASAPEAGSITQAGTPAAPSAPAAASSTQSNSEVPVIVLPSAPAAPFKHVSFFKIPADQTFALTLPVPGAAQNAADLQTYNQKIIALAGGAEDGALFLEIDEKDSAGNAASISELLAAANAPVISSQTLAADFNPDATFFVSHDAKGFWPGYVLALATGTTWSAAQGDVQAIESSPGISNLFLENVGTPSSAGFTSATIASSSVRVLAFSGGTVPGSFVYGWTPDDHYLILSTSQAGFDDALQRLGE